MATSRPARIRVFVDESIHDHLGFMVTAFVFATSDLTESICRALVDAGLVPKRDEFKSGEYMANKPRARGLRDALLSIAGSTKIAILIDPASERASSGARVLSALSLVVRTNGLVADQFEVSIDQGLVDPKEVRYHADELRELGAFEIRCDEDSRLVMGLQVADAVALSVAQVLREDLGFLAKTVPLGPESGYDEGIEAPLGWTLRMSLRHAFFVRPVVIEKGQDPNEVLDADLLNWGVFGSQNLEAGVGLAARRVFGQMWLGCIH